MAGLRHNLQEYIKNIYQSRLDEIKKKPDEITGDHNMCLTSTYCNTWTIAQAGREFFQNWLDGLICYQPDKMNNIKFSKQKSNNYYSCYYNYIANLYYDDQCVDVGKIEIDNNSLQLLIIISPYQH